MAIPTPEEIRARAAASASFNDCSEKINKVLDMAYSEDLKHPGEGLVYLVLDPFPSAAVQIELLYAYKDRGWFVIFHEDDPLRGNYCTVQVAHYSRPED